jgi:hypothetical protein
MQGKTGRRSEFYFTGAELILYLLSEKFCISAQKFRNRFECINQNFNPKFDLLGKAGRRSEFHFTGAESILHLLSEKFCISAQILA